MSLGRSGIVGRLSRVGWTVSVEVLQSRFPGFGVEWIMSYVSDRYLFGVDSNRTNDR